MDQPRLVGGRYELSSLLGRGGMAEVHLGRDVRLGRAVAVKTLRVDLVGDPTFQARFRREAQSAASLNHPAIVAVYDTGEDHLNSTPLPYIVMEYVEGTTLRELLQSGRRLLPERALEITAGVLTALEYSHRNGIVHRDIKPGNVMLTRSGHVKVMDFGIARAVADVGVTMTATAAVIGTAQYLSPEQAKGEPVDARSDIYSTGCLLYELLTGRPPFIGDSAVSVAYQHVREEPPLASNIDPEVPPDLDAIALKALAKNPDNRYQTADEMRADIDRALDGQPVSAPAVMAGGMLPAPRPGAVPTQVISPTAVIPRGPGGPGGPGEFGPGGPGGPYGGPPRRQGPPPKKQNKGVMYALVALAVIAVFAIAALFGNTLFGGGGGGGNLVGLPSVLNKPEADAIRDLENLGFTPAADPGCGGTSDQYAAGVVMSQNPAGGTEHERGTAVTLCISQGADVIAVPLIQAGTSVEEAEAALIAAGFEVARQDEASAEVDEGDVIRTNPIGGQEVARGSTVTIYVSTGPGELAVADVVGQDRATAEQTLVAQGFTVRVEEEVTGDIPAGQVYDQNPAGGTEVEVGSQVTIFVAKAPEQQFATVPNLDGFTEQGAKNALDGAGLKLGNVSHRPAEEGEAVNTVVEQSPNPQTQVAPGTTVDIVIADQPPTDPPTEDD